MSWPTAESPRRVGYREFLLELPNLVSSVIRGNEVQRHRPDIVTIEVHAGPKRPSGGLTDLVGDALPPHNSPSWVKVKADVATVAEPVLSCTDVGGHRGDGGCCIIRDGNGARHRGLIVHLIRSAEINGL